MEARRKEKKLTPKQEKFAQAVASGTKLKEAAVLAGYSHKNAARAGAFLANNEPLVQRRIQELQNRGAARATLTLSRESRNFMNSLEAFYHLLLTLSKERLSKKRIFPNNNSQEQNEKDSFPDGLRVSWLRG